MSQRIMSIELLVTAACVHAAALLAACSSGDILAVIQDAPRDTGSASDLDSETGSGSETGSDTAPEEESDTGGSDLPDTGSGDTSPMDSASEPPASDPVDTETPIAPWWCLPDEFCELNGLSAQNFRICPSGYRDCLYSYCEQLATAECVPTNTTECFDRQGEWYSSVPCGRDPSMICCMLEPRFQFNWLCSADGNAYCALPDRCVADGRTPLKAPNCAELGLACCLEIKTYSYQ